MNMYNNLKLLIKILLCGVFLSTAALAEPLNSDPRPPTPDMNLYSLITKQQGWLNTSRPLRPDDLKGRIILLDFWTYCCINCMHVIPELQSLEEEFGADLTVIGVHSAKFRNESDSENIRQAILRYGLHHPVVNDFDFSTWKSFGIHAWPTFVLINPKGIIENVYSGEGNRASIERDIEALQSKYAGSINKNPLPIALERDKQPPSILSFPSKLAYAPAVPTLFDGKPVLFVSDSGHQRIVVMTLDGTIVETIGSGKTGHDDGDYDKASFNTPQGLSYKNHILYIADTNNHLLRAIDFSTRTVMTLAGNGKQGNERNVFRGPAMEVSLSSPWDVTFYPDDRHLAIAMAGLHQLWSYDIENKTVSVLAGNGNESIEDGKLPDNALAQTSGLSALGDKLYFVDAETSSLRVLQDGNVTTLIGSGLFDFGYQDGAKGTALMQHPLGVFAADSGITIADSYNHSIRRYDLASRQLSTLAGNGKRGNEDGALASARFNEPNALMQIGNKLYVADTNNNAIRIVNLKTRKVSTLAIKEKSPEEIPEFSQNLPNAEKSAGVTVAAYAQVTITLGLKDGWHINNDAPSYLAVFDMHDTTKPVASFSHDTIRHGSVTLPALAVGKYRLQGTLYYCEDKAGSQCLLKSFDVPLAAKPDGDADMVLKLN